MPEGPGRPVVDLRQPRPFVPESVVEPITAFQQPGFQQPGTQQHGQPSGVQPRLADPGGPAPPDLQAGALYLGEPQAVLPRARTPPRNFLHRDASASGSLAFTEPTQPMNSVSTSGALWDSHEMAHDRLQDISARFSGFERQVEQDARVRKETEQAHFEEVFSRCSRLEHIVRVETHRGEESQTGLRSMLESRLAEAQGRLETLFLEKFDQLHSGVATMNERMQGVEATYAQASDSFIRDMSEESSIIHNEYWDIRRAFQDEFARHKECHQSLSTRVAELEEHSSQRIAHKQHHSDQKWIQLERETSEARRAGENAAQQYQDHMVARIEEVKVAIRNAARDREQADDDIVAALNHYTQTLQASLSSVSHRALLTAGL